MRWDIFCKVIDNHGDIGVCWRLCADLAARGESVRLFVDDASALAWMAPGGAAGVEVQPWLDAWLDVTPGDAVVEAFGCELPAAYQAALAARTRGSGRQPAWVNLEYLTAESFALRSHGLPSPVLAGPAAGLVKRFDYPGFAMGSGGLLREPGLLQEQLRFDRAAWLAGHGIAPDEAQLVSLFCYEPRAIGALLDQLAAAPRRTRLLVTAGRAAAAVRAQIARVHGSLEAVFLPLLPQPEFDRLLWACDFNFVRGEDSLVRALWAGKPFCWQIYPQHDDAHHAKLDAFLDWLQAPAALRAFFAGWNGMSPDLPALDAAAWADCARLARERLLVQDDLVTQLLRWTAGESAERA